MLHGELVKTDVGDEVVSYFDLRVRDVHVGAGVGRHIADCSLESSLAGKVVAPTLDVRRRPIQMRDVFSYSVRHLRFGIHGLNT